VAQDVAVKVSLFKTVTVDLGASRGCALTVFDASGRRDTRWFPGSATVEIATLDGVVSHEIRIPMGETRMAGPAAFVRLVRVDLPEEVIPPLIWRVCYRLGWYPILDLFYPMHRAGHPARWWVDRRVQGTG
jgi:hypothetical protein